LVRIKILEYVYTYVLSTNVSVAHFLRINTNPLPDQKHDSFCFAQAIVGTEREGGGGEGEKGGERATEREGGS
jgi:hypothetical protein